MLVKYSIEDLKEKLHTRQLEGVGERLEEDIGGGLNRAGIYFQLYINWKKRDMVLVRMKKNCRISLDCA